MFNGAADNEDFKEDCNEAEIESLKSEIARIRLAIAVEKTEIIEKEKYLAEISKDIRTDMEDIDEQKILINKLEKTIQEENGELEEALVQHRSEENRLQSLEKNFSDIIDKCKNMKITIDDSNENSTDLWNKFQVITAEIKTITDECKAVQKKCNETTPKKVVNGSNEENSKEISKYQSAIKRIRLKIMSIQTALAQKVKDCEALSTFHDNFAK